MSADLELVGAADTYKRGESLIRSTAFDLLLIDLQLGEESGIDLIGLCRSMTSARILVLSALGDESSVVNAISSGADGYLHKEAAMMDLSAAIKQVGEGEAPISPTIARHLIRQLQDSPDERAAAANLSPRELQLLKALARGYTYKEVASHYGLSYHTVVDYTRSLYRKLDVGSRTEAVVAGAQQGIISLSLSRSFPGKAGRPKKIAD